CATQYQNLPAVDGISDIGIYCDVGGENETIDSNRVYNMTPTDYSGTYGTAMGIAWESRCSRSKISRNTIYNIIGTVNDWGNGIGIWLRGSDCTGNSGNQILNNTVYNTTSAALWYWDGGIENTVVKNNIFYVGSNSNYINAETGPVACGGHVFNNNLYYRASGDQWYWDPSNVLTSLSAWRAAV